MHAVRIGVVGVTMAMQDVLAVGGVMMRQVAAAQVSSS